MIQIKIQLNINRCSSRHSFALHFSSNVKSNIKFNHINQDSLEIDLLMARGVKMVSQQNVITIHIHILIGKLIIYIYIYISSYSPSLKHKTIKVVSKLQNFITICHHFFYILVWCFEVVHGY